MKIALFVVAGLVALLVLVGLGLWAYGRSLPESHTTSATLRLAKSPAEVFGVLRDTAAIPTWDHGVDRVERGADRNGNEVWTWYMGRNVMTLEITTSEPPTLLRRTIVDAAGIFSGDWTYEVRADGTGTALVLTEHGRIHSAVPRALMGVADPAMYLKRHLIALSKHFGEEPKIEVGEFRRG